MNKYILILISIFLLFKSNALQAWGFWAHPRINRLAVFSLPPEMLPFFKVNIDFISRHSVKPDERRYAVEYEAPRHFIDIDHYGVYPFSNVPRKWKDAVEKFSQDTITEYGIVPWHIQVDYYRLVDAFKAKNAELIVKIASELGHYIADSHVPLHTTENYNGQMSGQKGIHGFWESNLPELFGDKYDFYVGQAYYIKNKLDEAWTTVLESHIALDSVLSFEKKLTQSFPSDQKYGYINRNNVLTRTYSDSFCKAYHTMLNGQVERRMRLAILRISSFWYSAWVDAGQPNLDELVKEKIEYHEDKFDKIIKIMDREAFLPGLDLRSMGCSLTRHNQKIIDFYANFDEKSVISNLFEWSFLVGEGENEDCHNHF